MARRRKSPLASAAKILVWMLFLALTGAAGVYFGKRETSRIRPPHLTPGVPQVPTPQPPEGTDTLLTAGTIPVPIIMYHDVVRRKQVWFDMSTRAFAEQMDQLATAGAHPVGMQDVYDHLKSGKPLPDKPILLTFDDCTLGQFTDALPILKRHRFPAVFFVQTGSVGVRTEKEHMSWDQLKEAEATGLITVESHTVTHPEDITTISDSALEREFTESRQTLEAELSHEVHFLAYPSGHCDAHVEQAALRAGYVAAVTMERGWAASPAQSLFLPRFTPKRVQEVIDGWAGSVPMAPPLPRIIAIKNTPLEYGKFEGGAAVVQWIAGGDLATMALNTRKTVGEMASEANAQAALNGTFFADARIASSGSAMIGPCLYGGSNYQPAEAAEEPRLEGRPLVLVGTDRCIVVPYAAHLGHSLDALRSVLSDARDAFLAGGWIVHNGKAIPRDVMETYSTGDFNDARHRAFVGIDAQNRYLLGATQDSVGTAALAQVLERMGVQEAWLMDSGFSTSLIWQNRVLVSGHTRRDVPSRPVPHALFLLGPTAPGALPPPADTPIASGPGSTGLAVALAADHDPGARRAGTGRRHRRHTHRRRTVTAPAPDAVTSPSAPATVAPETQPPASTPPDPAPPPVN